MTTDSQRWVARAVARALGTAKAPGSLRLGEAWHAHVLWSPRHSATLVDGPVCLGLGHDPAAMVASRCLAQHQRRLRL